jgi:hypothetical protein
MPINQTDYSVVVKLRAPPPNSWRWEIYRAGRRTPIEQSSVNFDTSLPLRTSLPTPGTRCGSSGLRGAMCFGIDVAAHDNVSIAVPAGDDLSEERKAAQIATAGHNSHSAKLITLAD